MKIDLHIYIGIENEEPSNIWNKSTVQQESHMNNQDQL